jgi:hypothetical protein
MNEPFIEKKLAEKWLAERMFSQYSVTVHPKDTGGFPERLLRKISDDGWEHTLREEKLVVLSNDPMRLARLVIIFQRAGYFVQED